jgi:hypothetical protein
MTDITEATPVQYENKPDAVIERLIVDADLAAGTSLYTGALCQSDGTALQEVKNIVASATSDFAGILDSDGKASERVDVVRKGYLVTSMAGTVAAGDEGTAVYAVDNNPLTITKSSTSNMPIGQINRVITAGTGANNKVVIYFEADGFASR